MTLADISQSLGAIGVVASVTYAALQIRDNSRAVRDSAYQSWIATLTSHWDEMARNPELCSLMLRGNSDFESLNRIEKTRVRLALMSLMRRYENAWIHLKNGSWKKTDVPSLHFQESICSAPGFWTAWPLIKTQSGDEFRAYIDSTIARHKAAIAAKPPEARPESGLRHNVKARKTKR